MAIFGRQERAILTIEHGDFMTAKRKFMINGRIFGV
jgi:hypothetical protein